MKSITQIRPLGSTQSIPISSIEKDYLTNIKKDRNPEELLENAIETGQIRLEGQNEFYRCTEEEATILRLLYKDFDNIIIGNPLYLSNYSQNISQDLIWTQHPNPIGGTIFRQTEFGAALTYLFGYDKYFRTKKKKGIWLAQKLNIRTCPYCNAQYTLVVKDDDDDLKARFQFDHFFSKKKYPYLSLSLYNLIPACASCNLNKGDKDLMLVSHFHPYYNEFDLSVIARFRTEFEIDVSTISIGEIDPTKLSITFTAINDAQALFVENHDKLFNIVGCYNRYDDIVQDLLAKAIIYRDAFKNDVMEIKGLFKGDESLYYRYLIGNYGLNSEVNERPLSKFTQDIALQFELFKPK